MQPDAAVDDVVDTEMFNSMKNRKRLPSIEALNSEMPFRENQKEMRKRILRAVFNKLRLRKSASATISRPDPTYKVAYLGNVVTGWAKGDGCVEKPLATLWRNYTHSSRPDVKMTVSVSNGGLKATTKDHGLTEYWAHRLTFCAAPSQFPRLFCWVYRHEGRRLRHELRCHAVLCPTPTMAKKLETELNQALTVALAEFRKDKISRQNARLSLANSVYENPSIPRRKILLSTGGHTYKPPLERSKSAPKLTMIEESILEEDPMEEKTTYRKILRHHDSFDMKKRLQNRYYQHQASLNIVPQSKETCDNDVDKTDLILDALLRDQMKNDLLESCERAWFNALGEKPDLIPALDQHHQQSLDSDEGSLSSGCESASTANSDSMDQPFFTSIAEEEEEEEDVTEPAGLSKTDLDFKLLGRSFETGGGVGGRLYNYVIATNEEVSLVPVGETQADFSSLKVFKKRRDEKETKGEDDAASAYSDESGYEEEELANCINNVVLV